MKKILLLLMIAVFCFGADAQAQQRTVTGKITDASDGQPIPGASVVERGTTNGVITDFDGNFSFTVSENASLVVSYIGYKTSTVQVGSRSTINVSLELDVTELSEVVVIGYGQIESRDATGAVERISSKDFNAGVIASPEQLIQGKSAGVQITTASGEPGAGVSIRIRGSTSVRNDNNPLFVIDGIPLSGSDVTAGGSDLGAGSSAPRNPLNFLNPNDIESIDILKDASATAIYGARGANGVVLITTKSGRGLGKTLTYDANVSIASSANRYDLLNRDQFLAGYEALGSDPSGVIFDNADTDWQDQIFRTAVSTKHDLAYGNSYGSGSYRVSLGYENQEGIVENSSLERINARVNWNHSLLNDRLNLNAQTTFSRVNDVYAPITNNAGFQGDLLGAALIAPPTFNSDFTSTGSYINPNELLALNQDQSQTDRALLNFSADYDITNNLNFRVNTGFDIANSVRSSAASRDLIIGTAGITGNGRAFSTEIDNSSTLFEALLNYKKQIGNGTLDILGGFSYQSFKFTGNNVSAFGFNTSDLDAMVNQTLSAANQVRGAIVGDYQQFGLNEDGFFANTLGDVAPTLGNPGAIPMDAITENIFGNFNEIQSFFGRANYNLQDKYLFTATLRADGSTRFGGNNKYGIFPSGAFAWRISDEDWAPVAFTNLKFRLGYGVTGNQEIPHNLHQPRQGFGDISITNQGGIIRPGLVDVAFANPDLRWEETAMTNIGFDFGFVNNRITGSIDAYYKNTTGLLIQIFSAQPAPNEFTWRNLDADVINQGVELIMNYVAIDKSDFTWNVGFNVSYNDNSVRNLGNFFFDTGEIYGQGLSGSFAQRIATNQPLFAWYMLEADGFDGDGNNNLLTTDPDFVGKAPIPLWNVGINTTASYKNWDFALFMNGQMGHYIYNNTANAFFTAGALGNGRNVTQNVTTSGEVQSNEPVVSTNFLERGDFLRIQNLSVGYNFNVENISFINGVRASINAQNLHVFTGYSGIDPEVNNAAGRGGIPSFGIDYTPFPRPRTFTIGLNVIF